MFSEILPTAGKSTLHLLIGNAELPKKICMVRRTGMVIDFYAPRVGFFPFLGPIRLREEIEGNRLLKTLEPPRHDRWDPSRAEDPRAQEALGEIKTWIREILKAQIPHIGEDQFNESEVPPRTCWRRNQKTLLMRTLLSIQKPTWAEGRKEPNPPGFWPYPYANI